MTMEASADGKRGGGDHTVRPQAGFQGESVIFIISQHRSGSTLLQRVLGGHSQIQTAAETFLMLHPLYALKTTGFRAEYREWEARVAVSDYLEHFAGGEQTYIDALRAMAAVLYGRAIEGTGKRYFLDKTPRYTNIIPELCRVLPQAKYIFLLRNPLSILRSQLEHWEHPTSFQHLSLLTNETILAPPRILAGMDLLGPDAIVVRYEEFVSAPERVVAGICERLGLTFEPAMIDYGDRPDPPGRGRFYDSRGLRKHRRPTTTSLEKWHSLAKDPQQRHIARSFLVELGPVVVQRLGYSFDELLRVVSPADDGNDDVVCSWQSLMIPAAEADAYLEAFPGTGDFKPSPSRRREKPSTPSRVSVVIPTHGNSACFERSLRSVILQGRPNVEIIVAPDATQPGSEGIVAKYAPWLAAVTDPAPGGFFDAVQRGLQHATGDVLTWLRPDEEHMPWTLATVGAIFSERVDVEWVCGTQQFELDPAGRPIGHEPTPESIAAWLRPIPNLDGKRVTPLRFSFIRRSLWHRGGARLDTTLVDAADCELAIRLAGLARPTLAPSTLGGFRTVPWWVATRHADEADEYIASLDPAHIPSVSFARLRRDVANNRWLVFDRAEEGQ